MIRPLWKLAVCTFGLCTVVTGCDDSNACIAVAWQNEVSVKLDGDAADVELVEFCVDGVCSIPREQPPRDDSPDSSPEHPSPSTTSDTSSRYKAEQDSQTHWTISMEMTTPEDATVRALSDNGEVLAEKDVSLDWTRVGGSEECGGPHEAGPVTLSAAE